MSGISAPFGFASVDRPVQSPVTGESNRQERITGPPTKVSAATLFRGAYSVSADGATNQQLDVSIQWARPSMAKWYDVYLDTVDPPTTKVSDNQTARVFVPTLALDTTYYLRIDAANALGSTTGDVLSFSTWAAADIWTDDNDLPWTDGDGNYIPHETE